MIWFNKLCDLLQKSAALPLPIWQQIQSTHDT